MSSSQEQNFRKAKQAVFCLLKFRQRSEYEVRERLKSKSTDPEIINTTISYFLDLGLLDDRDFTQKWISYRMTRSFGLNRIRRELHEKGINTQIIQEELESITDQYSEIETARELSQHRAQTYHNVPEDKIKARLFNYLLRRGFSKAVIYKVIKEL